MQGPTTARLTDLHRTHAWSFVTWCFMEGVVSADLDLLLAKTPGGLYIEWGQRHPADVARVLEVAHRFGWSANWTRDVSHGGLVILRLRAGKRREAVGAPISAAERTATGAPRDDGTRIASPPGRHSARSLPHLRRPRAARRDESRREVSRAKWWGEPVNG